MDGLSAGFNGPCKKIAYRSRAVARRFGRGARSMPDRQSLRAYKCRDCGFWHLGHLPRAIRRGQITRRARYGA